MGNGESVLMPYINSWLKKDQSNPYRQSAETEVNKRIHPVPSGDKEMQVSQNLFLLEAGSDAVLHGSISDSLEQQLITRLKRERDEIGLWGSECTSPIYHHFIISGLSAIYHNTSNAELKDLIEQNLGSFFWYALRMGLADSKHGLIGMRGTGHDFAESGFPALHFVCQYFTSGRPTNYKQLSGWKDWLNDTGWAVAGLPGGRNYDLYKKAFEYAVDETWKPWRLRSKLTFLKVDGDPVAHFYERGINGNTPALLAYVSPYRVTLVRAGVSTIQGGLYLPINHTIRKRQGHDNSVLEMSISKEFLSTDITLKYTGAYTELVGGQHNSIRRSWTDKKSVMALTSDLFGVSGWTQIYPSKSVPDDAPAPIPTPPRETKKRKRRWWEFWR